MPRSSTFLRSLHEQLSTYYTPEAVAMVVAVLETLAAHPAHLLPQTQKPPEVRHAPVRPPHHLPTYFRMNERLDLVEVAPPLLELLEVDDPNHLLGDHWEQFLEPEERKRLLEMWMWAAQTHDGFTHLFRFRTPKGRTLLLRKRVYPLRDTLTRQFHGWFGHIDAVSKVIKITVAPGPSVQRSA